MNKRKELETYLTNCEQEEYLRNKLAEVIAQLEDIEVALLHYGISPILEEALEEEAKNLRLQRLDLKMKINKLEKQIYNFQTLVEVAE